MMKLLILGLMAALTYAAPPMGMPPMMMPGNMMMGVSPLSFMSGGIPPEALEMLKNLKPEDIKAAVENMPPEMKNMMAGMGISQEQLDEAVQSLPEDLTPLVEKVSKKLESGDVAGLAGEVNSLMTPELKANLKQSAMTALKTEMKDMGVDLKEDEDVDSIMEKAKNVVKEKLKKDGLDIDDPEALQAKVMAELRKIADASPDESDDEVKTKIAQQLLQELKEEGYDVDPENPLESVEALKNKLKDSLKEMDIDVGDDELNNFNNIPEVLKKAIMSGKMGHPLHLMMSAMTMFSSGAQPQQMMMPPGPMGYPGPRGPRGPQGPQGLQMRPYVQGAEDALIHVFGGEDDVIQNLMEVREGAMRGAIPESALFGLMKDLLHYRLEARVLLAQNRMLEEKLAMNSVRVVPPFRSSFALRALGCRHMH